MYTLAEFTEQVFIQLSGGKITQDTLLRREDIKKYVPGAINWGLTKQYYLNKQAGEDLPQNFVATFENIEVSYNPLRDLKFITLPAPLLALPKDAGLDTVSPMKGNWQFIRTKGQSRQHDSYTLKNQPDITVYWMEGQIIYFLNLPDQLDKLLVRLMGSVGDLADDEILPIPAGMEIELIDVCTKFFLEQLKMPSERLNDNNADK